MHLRQSLIAVATVLLAACATPAPEPAAPEPPPQVAAAAPEPPPPPSPPKAAEPEMFPGDAGAELLPLPPPVGDLWERIVVGYAMPELEGPLVEKWEQWYAARPEYVARMVERSRRYLYHIVTEVSARDMPTEIALLPMIESAYNPAAMSVARAAGIWQFIPSTGKHYGLKQDFWVDSRRDVLAATDKALLYLFKLHEDFDDWQLALAGYNWGEGNVAKAVARNKAKGLPTTYESLKMPAETANYLPKLQAVKNIVRDPEKYGLVLADIPDAPYFAVVKTTRKMDTKRAAEIAELSLEDFLALNPQHNRPVIAGADEQSILLPIDNAEIFAAKLELTEQPLVSWQAYRIKANESLPQVAAKYGMSVETLRAVNGIGARSRVPVGHTLLVPSERPSYEAAQTLSQAVFTAAPAGRTFYYTVQRGDTLNRIAAHYDVTVEELKSWNSMKSDRLATGRKLRVTSDIVPVAKAGGKSKSAVATRGAGKQVKPTQHTKQAKRGEAARKKPAVAAPKTNPTARANGQFGG
ncbi:MAG: LysM peptidoglycan-binding domain-containing protein [Burkholderiales bacterium]|nr:LysM peptidoglycan-binding domain-containing protein [Burkholderiales bacterium]